MKVFIWIIFAFVMTSCGHKQWTKRGFDKGWIDTVRSEYTDTIYIDSNKVQERVDTFLLALWDTLEIESPCDSVTRKLTPKGKATIRYMIEKELVPVIQYPSDSLRFHDKKGNKATIWAAHGKWFCKMEVKEQNYGCTEPSSWQLLRKYWLELIVVFCLGTFLGLLIRK